MSGRRAAIPKAPAARDGCGNEFSGGPVSLINQMLRDIDARRSNNGDSPLAAHDEVRVLPAAKTMPLAKVWLGVAAVGVIGAGAFFGGAYLFPSAPGLSAAPPLSASLLPVPVVPVPPVAAGAANPTAAPVAAPAAPAVVSAPMPAAVPDARLPKREAATAVPPDGAKTPTGKINEPPVAKTVEKNAEKIADKTAEKVAEKSEKSLKPATARIPTVRADEPAIAPVPSESPAKRRDAAATRFAAAQPAGGARANPSIERSNAVRAPRERAELEYRKAIEDANLGRMSDAVDGLQRALREDAQHIPARQLLLKFLLEAKRTDEALPVLQDGLQAQPAHVGWAMSLARLQVDRGDLGGAWTTLEQTLPAAGNNADYLGFAGYVARRLGRNDDAAARYLAATRVAPADGRWWLGLGLAFDAEGRVNEARDALTRAKACGNLNAELSAIVERKLR